MNRFAAFLLLFCLAALAVFVGSAMDHATMRVLGCATQSAGMEAPCLADKVGAVLHHAQAIQILFVFSPLSLHLIDAVCVMVFALVPSYAFLSQALDFIPHFWNVRNYRLRGRVSRKFVRWFARFELSPSAYYKLS